MTVKSVLVKERIWKIQVLVLINTRELHVLAVNWNVLILTLITKAGIPKSPINKSAEATDKMRLFDFVCTFL